MAKKRKTRDQKKLADLRHEFQHSLSSEKLELKLQPATIKTQKSETQYPYLAKDLARTALLSSLIIAFQISLFLILKNHLINIPGISY